MKKIKGYAGKVANVLNDCAVGEITSAKKLDQLALQAPVVQENISPELKELAAALYSYCRTLDLQQQADHAEPLVFSICKMGLYSVLAEDWREMEPLVNILANQSPTRAVRLAQGLSAVARELSGHGESQRILESTIPLLDKVEPRQSYSHLASLANNAKDSGNFKKAEELYIAALDVGRKNAISLAPVLFQIGRIELELSRDLKRAIELFDESLEQGFEVFGTDGSWELRVYISKIFALTEMGDKKIAFKTYIQALKNLPDQGMLLPAEAGLHHAVIPMATEISHGLLNEWLARMSAAGVVLAGVVREREASIAELARAMTNLGFPSEVEILLAHSGRDVDQFDIGLARPAQCANVANAHRLRGDYDAAVEYFEKAVEASLISGESETLLPGLGQLALCKQLNGDKSWTDTQEELFRIKNNHSSSYTSTETYLNFIDGANFLEQPVANLDNLLESIHSASNSLSDESLGAFIPPLSRLHNLHHDLSGENWTSPLRELSSSIDSEGYLCSLRSLFGLNPKEIIDWALSDRISKKIHKNLLLESLINMTGIATLTRYAAPALNRKWVKALPEFRAIFSRWVYEATYKNETPDLTNLRDFYKKWRKYEAANDILDILDHSDKQSRNNPNEFDENNIPPKLINYQESSYLNNFLFNQLKKSDKSTPLYVIDLFQRKSELVWSLIELGSSVTTTTLHRVNVEFSKQQAAELVHDLQTYIEREQHGQLCNKNLLTAYQNLVTKASVNIMQPLEEIIRTIPRESIVRLRLSAPWNAIPLEQLPLALDGRGLIDYFMLTRIDSFSKWINVPSKLSNVSFNKSDFLSISHEGPEQATLPIATHHNMLEKHLGEIPTLEHWEKVKKHSKSTKIMDYFGHGALKGGLGAQEIFILQLIDRDVLAQEIVATNISECNLVILNSCRLAMNSVKRDIVTEAIPNFADHLLSSGVESVVAALHVVSAKAVTTAMPHFYQALFNHNALSLAARQGWGFASRQKSGYILLPMVLFGADRHFYYDKIEAS